MLNYSISAILQETIEACNELLPDSKSHHLGLCGYYENQAWASAFHRGVRAGEEEEEEEELAPGAGGHPHHPLL